GAGGPHLRSTMSATPRPAAATAPRPLPAWAPVASLTSRRRRLSCCHVIGGRLWGDRRLRFATPRAALELVSVYPDLDSDHAERGLGGGTAKLDVGAQRVKGHAPLPILLAA